MTIYYSAENNGFYDTNIHGELTISEPDQSWEPTGDETEEDRPSIEKSNPNCKIPAGAIEITSNQHQQLMDAQSNGKILQAATDGKPEAVERPLTPLAERRKRAKDAIDTAAGKARERYVSKGYLIEEEYRLAKNQTQQWRDSGSPANAVPASVQVWADAMGADAETAAQDIETTAAAWEQVIQSIRSLRLAGKAAVNGATSKSKEKDMAEVAQPFVDQLNAMQP